MGFAVDPPVIGFVLAQAADQAVEFAFAVAWVIGFVEALGFAAEKDAVMVHTQSKQGCGGIVGELSAGTGGS